MHKHPVCRVAIALIVLALLGSHASAHLIPVTHCSVGTVRYEDGSSASSNSLCWTDYEDDGSSDSGAFPSGGGGDRNGGHGGPVNNDNRGDHVDVTDASQGDPCDDDGSNPISGNPIVLSTGNKVEPELDFASAGEMPLTLRRTYDHFWKYPGLFGKYWISSFDYSLVWQNNDALIFAQRPDGRRIKFVRVGTTNRWNEDKLSPVAYIVKNADGTYTHATEDIATETYDGGGKPLVIKDPHGIGWTFTYAANHYPTRITHTSGRYIQLTWTSGQLTSVTDPTGAVYAYTYTANAFGSGLHRLASSTRPGATGDPAATVAYFYENPSFPGGLTGKSFNGVRYSTFAYDAQARAVSSEHATGGIDRMTYAYTGVPVSPPAPPPDPPPPGSDCNPSTHTCPAPPVIDDGTGDAAQIAANAAQAAAEDDVIAHVDATTSVLETNPLGLKTTYEFLDGKLTTVSGQATAHCGARSRQRSYDANGNEALVTDFNGIFTDTTYNSKGQLTQKIEAYNTAVARTTTYAWDPTYNRLTSETVAGDHQTSYTYTADQRLASVTVKNLSANGVLNQTHVWTFAYTKYASGLVQTMIVDGPQVGTGDKITYSYSAAGDLVSVTNTHGHATSFSVYNALGQPGRTIGPNSDQTDIAYFPDGRLKQVTTYPNNIAATTAFTYAAGLLASSKTADNITTTYTYDAVRRLTKEDRPELNGTAEERITYDLASNPTIIEIYRGATLRYRTYIDYDEASRVRARRGNNSQNVRYAYDNNDNPTAITDSLNRVTHFAYDALNRLTQETDAKNGITKYEYDKADRITKVTDPKLLATTYAYDGFGQLWHETSPDSGTTTYAYTSSGFRNLMTRADGIATGYAYDDIGRLTSISAGGKTQTFAYDACTSGKGRVCTIVDPTGTLTYTYTKEGRIASHEIVHAPVHGGLTYFSYTYDAMGRPATITNNQSVDAAAVHLHHRPAFGRQAQDRCGSGRQRRHRVPVRADGSNHRLYVWQRHWPHEDLRSGSPSHGRHANGCERHPDARLCLQRERCDHDTDQQRQHDAVAELRLRRADAPDRDHIAIRQRSVHLRCERQPIDAHDFVRTSHALLHRRQQPTEFMDARRQHHAQLQLQRRRQHDRTAWQGLHLRSVQPLEQSQRRRIHDHLRRQRTRRAHLQKPRRRRIVLRVRARSHAARGLHAQRDAAGATSCASAANRLRSHASAFCTSCTTIISGGPRS